MALLLSGRDDMDHAMRTEVVSRMRLRLAFGHHARRPLLEVQSSTALDAQVEEPRLFAAVDAMIEAADNLSTPVA